MPKYMAIQLLIEISAQASGPSERFVTNEVVNAVERSQPAWMAVPLDTSEVIEASGVVAGIQALIAEGAIQ